jgi:restriction endonuclease Mrr
MNAQKGTRGIFVTTSSFHPAAEKLLLSLPNCVGIDGKKLFSLVKQTVYGIHKTKSGFSFDNAIFIR